MVKQPVLLTLTLTTNVYYSHNYMGTVGATDSFGLPTFEVGGSNLLLCIRFVSLGKALYLRLSLSTQEYKWVLGRMLWELNELVYAQCSTTRYTPHQGAEKVTLAGFPMDPNDQGNNYCNNNIASALHPLAKCLRLTQLGLLSAGLLYQQTHIEARHMVLRFTDKVCTFIKKHFFLHFPPP